MTVSALIFSALLLTIAFVGENNNSSGS
jgi:hypothetical protein